MTTPTSESQPLPPGWRLYALEELISAWRTNRGALIRRLQRRLSVPYEGERDEQGRWVAMAMAPGDVEDECHRATRLRQAEWREYEQPAREILIAMQQELRQLNVNVEEIRGRLTRVEDEILARRRRQDDTSVKMEQVISLLENLFAQATGPREQTLEKLVDTVAMLARSLTGAGPGVDVKSAEEDDKVPGGAGS